MGPGRNRALKMTFSLLAITIFGLAWGWWAVQNADRNLREDLLRDAQSMAQGLNGERVKTLTGTAADLASPAYQRLKKQLAAVRDANEKIRFVYLMGLTSEGHERMEGGESDHIFFFVDSERSGSPDESAPGSLFDESPPGLLDVFRKNTAVVEGPVTDRWGTWVSAWVPVHDSFAPGHGPMAQGGSARPVAVLGMDVAAHEWKRDMLRATVPALLLTLALLSIAVAGFFLSSGRCASASGKGSSTPMRQLEPLLTLAVGFTLTVFGAWMAHERESQSRSESFKNLAMSKTAGLVDAFRDLRDTELESLARFHESSEEVSEEEFQRYTEFLTKNPAVRAWEWVPAVSAGNRSRFEEKARNGGLSGFEIWEKDALGNRVPAMGREVYFPVFRVAPLAGNETALGYDLGSEPLRRAALEEAAETGFVTGTDPIVLVQDTGTFKSMLICRAVYHEEGPGSVRGYALALLQFETALRRALEDGTARVELALLRKGADPEQLAAMDCKGCENFSSLSMVRPFFAFGKAFSVKMYPEAEFMSLHPMRAGWLLLVSGMVLTAALTFTVHMVIRRREDLEALVQERTTALVASEEHLSATLRSIGDGVISADGEGRVTSLNLVAEELTGWKSAQAQGLPVEEVFRLAPSQTRAPVENPVRRALREGITVGLEDHTVLISSHGAEYQVADSCAPIRGAEGDISGAVLVFRDMSDEYRNRQALEESEEKHRVLFTHSPDAYLIVRDGVIVDCNRSAQVMFGGSREQIVGRAPYVFSPPLQPDGRPSAEAGTEVIAETLKSGRGRFQWMHRRLDGVDFWVEVSLSTMKMGGKGVIFTSCRDITGRKQAEEALRAEEGRMRAISVSAQDAIVMMDPRGCVSFWNPAAEKIFGHAREEAMGQSLHVLLAPQRYHASCQTALEVFHRTGHGNAVGKILELEACRRDGREISIELSLSALELPDGWHAVGIMRDITERKRADEGLREMNEALEQQTLFTKEMAVRAEMASKAKSEFLANMSHEIRTPMNGILGMIGLLVDTELTEEQRHYAEAVRASSDSLLNLINDILDFSKIEAGKLELETLDFDLQNLLDDLAVLSGLRAQEKGLELICSADPEMPTLLRGDPGRLRQVLANLVGNAIKFTHEGEVDIRVSLESGTEEEVLLRFTVRDTGIGIPRDKVGILFDQFTQVDASTTRRYGGTGLGLAISRQLVAMMEGRIGVESEEGRGSEFWFTARLGMQAGQSVSRSHSPVDLRGVRVLIVDDNATNREILDRRLSSWGMCTAEAPEGPRALAALYAALEENDPFRIALLDMQMPGMDGEALGRAIKGDPRLNGTRLVMMTSLGMGGEARRLEEMGFVACLTKPTRNEDLKKVLSLALGEWNENSLPPPAGSPAPGSGDLREQLKKSEARILLAEDNLTNQQVALGILRKLHLRADTVCNGAEALRALKATHYDLVLMDVQMPVMDGLTATRKIRDLRSSVLNHEVPIIAMTARAMLGDREKCLAVGMNDYVSKPVTPQILTETLAKWLSIPKGEEPRKEKALPVAPQGEGPRGDMAIWDREAMMERVMGDEELAKEVLQGFLEDIPRQILALRSFMEKGDLSGAELQSHSIKGASSSVGGEALREAASRVELVIGGGDLAAARIRVEELETQFEQLRKVLENL